MPDDPVLRGEVVVLRRATVDDVAGLAAIVESPAVSRWWGTPFTAADVAAEDAVGFAVEVGGELAGFVQYSEENEPGYRHAGIDIFLAATYQGRGLGTDAVRTVARHLFEERRHHRLTIDPAADNARAIASYSKVGFRPVGVMRKYERGSDGTWHDGLLMDLLRDELR
jgi:aminoglycoside 6'-N-acetyltransferase